MATMTVVDYKELLKKYIRHVKNENGGDFIAPMYFVGNDEFTKQDYRSLRDLSREIDNERTAKTN